MTCRAKQASDAPAAAPERVIRLRVRALRAFYRHVVIFVTVNGSLAVWHALNPESMRHPPLMIFGWGLALVIHGLRVLIDDRWLGREWESSQVQKRLQRQGGQAQS